MLSSSYLFFVKTEISGIRIFNACVCIFYVYFCLFFSENILYFYLCTLLYILKKLNFCQKTSAVIFNLLKYILLAIYIIYSNVRFSKKARLHTSKTVCNHLFLVYLQYLGNKKRVAFFTLLKNIFIFYYIYIFYFSLWLGTGCLRKSRFCSVVEGAPKGAQKYYAETLNSACWLTITQLCKDFRPQNTPFFSQLRATLRFG